MLASRNISPPWERIRLVGLLVTCLLAARGFSQTTVLPPPAQTSGRYAEVTVDPTHTIAYLAKISLNLAPFTRHDAVYTSDYTVKVFPFFMFNEHGRI